MRRMKGIYQETLKLIGCASMFIAHCAFLFPPVTQTVAFGESVETFVVPFYNIIGRISFPIFCFLTVEGFHHTGSRKKYALRLFLLAILSEIPFDLRPFSGLYWEKSNVVFTLLLGYLALILMDGKGSKIQKAFGIFCVAVLAEVIRCDYGAGGVLMILLFQMTRSLPHKRVLQFVGLLVLSAILTAPGYIVIGGHGVSIQFFAVAALLPISLYNGEKKTQSKAVQLAFYAFYPVHWLVARALVALVVT